MKVKELVAKLKCYHPNMEIKCEDKQGSTWYPEVVGLEFGETTEFEYSDETYVTIRER